MSEREELRKIFESCDCAQIPDEGKPSNLVEAKPPSENPFRVETKVIITGAVVETVYKDKETGEATEAKSFNLNLDWEAIGSQLSQAVREAVEQQSASPVHPNGGSHWYLEASFVNEEYERRS